MKNYVSDKKAYFNALQSLVRFGNHCDKNGLCASANQIDEIIKNPDRNACEKIISLADQFDLLGRTGIADQLDKILYIIASRVLRSEELSWKERRIPFHQPNDDVEFTEYLVGLYSGKKASRLKDMVDNALNDKYEWKDIAEEAKNLFDSVEKKARYFLNEYSNLKQSLVEADMSDQDKKSILSICNKKIAYYKKTLKALNVHDSRLKSMKDAKTSSMALSEIIRHIGNVIMEGEKIEADWPTQYDKSYEPERNEKGQVIQPGTVPGPKFAPNNPNF